CFFFFQAEDGIRDFHVTGVQTCALPISLGGFGATVAEAFTWHTAFRAFGLIGIVYAIILIFFLHETKSAGAILKTAQEKLVKQRSEERRVGKECRTWWAT